MRHAPGQSKGSNVSSASAAPTRPVTTHRLKAYPGQFRAVKRGVKGFEIRKDDRGFAEGHHLLLQEWDAEDGYTNDELMVLVTYLTRGPDRDLPRGMVVMSIKPIPMPIHVKGDDAESRRQRVVHERKQRDAAGTENL